MWVFLYRDFDKSFCKGGYWWNGYKLSILWELFLRVQSLNERRRNASKIMADFFVTDELNEGILVYYEM